MKAPKLTTKTVTQPKRTECLTCSRSLQSSSFPKLPQEAGCDHARETCRPCWCRWLKAQVALGPDHKITCAQCPGILGPNDIKKLASPATNQAYLDAKLRAVLGAEGDFHWCTTSGCGNGQNVTDNHKFPCSACGITSCVACKVPWHEGLNCQEYQDSLVEKQAAKTKQRIEQEEAASLMEIERSSKICPGPGCKRNVEKISGCDHMRCTKCRHEFCWICLAPYRRIFREGNDAHQRSCKHHTDNLERSGGDRITPLDVELMEDED